MDILQYDKHYNKNINLFNADEAINLGNLFKDLYMSYQGFSNYCFQAMNKREKLLFEIQKNNFCAHEINLYLDTHKANNELCQLYHQYLRTSKELTKQYSAEYGPLNISQSNCNNSFEWIKGPWPWENK